MNNEIQVHYLEIVTPHVDQMCESYCQVLGISFSDTISVLGNARTAPLSAGGTLGIRLPMHAAEVPVTRPYYLVSDIEKAVKEKTNSGAQIMLPPMDIPGYGKCAILNFGTIQSGLWQV